MHEKSDVLYITVKGLFVIESKNYSGWIFGAEDQFKWTVVLKGGVKKRFYNPILQNKNHLKWLREYLGIDVPLFSIVVFSKRCELKQVSVSSDNVRVIKRDRLSSTKVTDSAEGFKDDVPLCPRCGAPMVLRVAKRGEHMGKRFYGCSRYPQCHAIVNVEE